MNITKTPEDIKLLYKFILNEIRDLEIERDKKKNAQKIEMLDNILDIFGTMLLAAAEEH